MQDGSHQRVWHVADNVFVYIIRLLRPNEDDIAQVNTTLCGRLLQLSCSSCMTERIVIPRCISSIGRQDMAQSYAPAAVRDPCVFDIFSKKFTNMLILYSPGQHKHVTRPVITKPSMHMHQLAWVKHRGSL